MWQMLAVLFTSKSMLKILYRKLNPLPSFSWCKLGISQLIFTWTLTIYYKATLLLRLINLLKIPPWPLFFSLAFCCVPFPPRFDPNILLLLLQQPASAGFFAVEQIYYTTKSKIVFLYQFSFLYYYLGFDFFGWRWQFLLSFHIRYFIGEIL